VRELTGESARGLSIRMADSELLQWFCGIDRVDVVRVPSKSALDRYEKLVPETVVRKIVDQLNGLAATTGEEGQSMLELEKPLDIEALFLDTSCVKANIHFPVDWVLLRDATRTLMKAVTIIRRHGWPGRYWPTISGSLPGCLVPRNKPKSLVRRPEGCQSEKCYWPQENTGKECRKSPSFLGFSPLVADFVRGGRTTGIPVYPPDAGTAKIRGNGTGSNYLVCRPSFSIESMKAGSKPCSDVYRRMNWGFRRTIKHW